MVQKMKTLQAQKKDMSRKQIITFALVVTYAIASRAMNSSLMANYDSMCLCRGLPRGRLTCTGWRAGNKLSTPSCKLLSSQALGMLYVGNG